MRACARDFERLPLATSAHMAHPPTRPPRTHPRTHPPTRRYSCWDGRFTRDRCCNTRINVPACAVGRSGVVSDAVKLAAVQVGDAQCAAVTALGCCAADILAMESTLVFDGFPQTIAPTQVGRPFDP